MLRRTSMSWNDPEEEPVTSAPAFLQTLEGHRDHRALQHVSGTIRFDLRRGDSVTPWSVRIVNGSVSVAHRKVGADCIAIMDEDLFVAITRGEVNAVAAALRGDIEMEGQVGLLLAFQRLFPGPPWDERLDREERSPR